MDDLLALLLSLVVGVAVVVSLFEQPEALVDVGTVGSVGLLLDLDGGLEGQDDHCEVLVDLAFALFGDGPF